MISYWPFEDEKRDPSLTKGRIMNKTIVSNLNPEKKRESPVKAKEFICSSSTDPF